MCDSLKVFLFVCTAVLFVSCKSDYQASQRQSRAGDNRAPRQVKTTPVAETPFGETVTANGTLAAFDQTTVSVKVPGRVRAISIDLGSVVRRGQVIAQVDSQDYHLRVQQAEAGLAQARARLGLAPQGNDDRIDPEQTSTVRQARAVYDEAKFNRDRAARLVEQGVIAKAEFDSANAAFKVAEGRYQDAYEEVRNRQGILAQRKSELDLARQQLKDTSVVAPLDGIVQEKLASIGEYMAAGAPVVRPHRAHGSVASAGGDPRTRVTQRAHRPGCSRHCRRRHEHLPWQDHAFESGDCRTKPNARSGGRRQK